MSSRKDKILPLFKTAALESSTFSDSKTGKAIRVSTTMRKIYRETVDKEVFTKIYGSDILSNKLLNDLIAQDFISSSDGTMHMFLANTSPEGDAQREWVEIRRAKVSVPFNYFLAIRRASTIDIISVIKDEYKVPKKSRII